MIAVVAAVLAGLAAATVLLRMGEPLLRHPVLQRENYRGHGLPTAAGLFIPVTTVAVEGGRTLLWAAGLDDAPIAPARFAVLAAVVGFAFLGFVDDLLGDGGDRGLRGHLGAVLHGRLTTGFVKLAGGAALALAVAAALGPGGRGQLVVDGALIALGANLANLFDRAPGRVLKWATLSGVLVGIVAGSSLAGQAQAAVLGAGLALLAGDLRERFMVGDTGANAIGAAVATAAVAAAGPGARQAVVIALVALTLLSEFVSFSRIIAAVPPLRWFDQVGRERRSA